MRAVRVLIVEDNADVTDSLADLFALAGFLTRVYRSGLGAAAEAFRPDAVVLDLSLPGRSGLEVAAELAALNPRPRVAVYTGVHNLGPCHALPPGVVDRVVVKLGEPQELIEWVRLAD